MSNVEIRTAYGGALVELGAKDKRVVVLDADVSSSAKSALFAQAYPSRHYNMGIAELNMVATAAGMATAGLIPFVNTFATFMALRAADPVQNQICYDRLNVKLAGAYSGLSDSYDGASHQAISDLALMRAMPNMTILSPCDEVETKQAVFAAAAYDGPVYLRLSRSAAAPVNAADYRLAIGKGTILRLGEDVVLFATGLMVQQALAAADLLATEGFSACVVNLSTIKPLDTELVCQCAKRAGCVVTVEEHSAIGGLGSAVCEALAGKVPVPIEMVGIPDVFGESGAYGELLAKFGLDARGIVDIALRALAEKQGR